MTLDKRQVKTRKAIFDAFGRLLKDKKYEAITIKDILDEALISRSTFYDHFQTKEDMLQAMCSDIFDHVLSNDENHQDIHHILEHILIHLGDGAGHALTVFKGEGSGPFALYLTEGMRDLFLELHTDCSREGVPAELGAECLAAGFVATFSWWVRNGCSMQPSEVVTLFLKASGLES